LYKRYQEFIDRLEEKNAIVYSTDPYLGTGSPGFEVGSTSVITDSEAEAVFLQIDKLEAQITH
jgi:hypothetical protein